MVERLFRRAAGKPVAAATIDDRAAAVLDALGDWICGIDAIGRLTYVNASFARDHGGPAAMWKSRLFIEFVPPASRDAVRLALNRTASLGESQTFQHETLVNGVGAWRQWTVQRVAGWVPGGSATATCLIATGRDITEQKRLEHQFLHSQRLGSIGMLASGIAHDLNNVLAPIVMSIDLLKLRGGTEENRALLDIVAASADRGASLISHMLSFTRGLDGDHDIVDLTSLVKELGRFIGRTFSKNIQVHVAVATDLRSLHANPTQVYQVLLNLCVNARDAMPQGGELTITAANATLDEAASRALPGSAPGEYVAVGVCDTGTGIAPEVLGRIFDPFFTTKPVGEGTGLGLSTVRSIVKGCSGFLTLSTKVGRGTSFHVYFPVAARSEPARAEPPGLENVKGRGEHVLVVDDEEFFRDVTCRLLLDFGYVVHVAADGAEAVRIFERHSHEIVVAVVDLNMPVMGGRAAIKVLQAIKPELRVIAVSGSDDAARAKGQGEEHELTKPYAMGDLLRCLREVLDQPPAGATSEERIP